MRNQVKPISTAIDELKQNLTDIARVCEWADILGYKNPNRFANKIRRYYGINPMTILTKVRLKSIIQELRECQKSNFEIAREHGLPDEKALNKYMNYHFGCSPSEIKTFPFNKINQLLEKFDS